MTIDISNYDPNTNARYSRDQTLTLPNELVLDDNGACESLYWDGERVLYTTMNECLQAHDLDADHIVGWLSDEGREDAAELVAVLTDPERAERAQAAAIVAELK